MKTELVFLFSLGMIFLVNCENAQTDPSSEKQENDSDEQDVLMYTKWFLSDDKDMLIIMTPANPEAESSKEYRDLKSLPNENNNLNEVTSIPPELRIIIAKTIAGHIVHLKSLTTSCPDVTAEKDSPKDNIEDLEQNPSSDPFMYNLSLEDSKTVQVSSRTFSDRSDYRKMMSAKDFIESKNKTVTGVNSTMENMDFNTENEDDLEELNSMICYRIFEGLRGNIVVKNVQINEHTTGLTIRHKADSERLLFVLFSDKLHEALKPLQSVEVDFQEGDLKKTKATGFHIPELVKSEMIDSDCKELSSKLLSDTLQIILDNFPGIDKEEGEEMFEVESHDDYTFKDGDSKKSAEVTNVSITYRLHQFPAIRNVNLDEAVQSKDSYRRHRSVYLDSSGYSEDVQNNNSRRLLLNPTDSSRQKIQKIVGLDLSIADGYVEKRKMSFISRKNADLKSYADKKSDSAAINFVPTVANPFPEDTKIDIEIEKLRSRQLSTTVSEVTSDSSIEEYDLKDTFSRLLAEGMQLFSLLNAKNNKYVLSNTSKEADGIKSQADTNSEGHKLVHSKVYTPPYIHSNSKNSENAQNSSKMPDSKDAFSRVLAQGILIFSQVNAKKIPSSTSKEIPQEINKQRDRDSGGLDGNDSNINISNTLKESVTNRKKRDIKTPYFTHHKKKSDIEKEFSTNTQSSDAETETVAPPVKKAIKPLSMIHVMLPFPEHIITTSELSYTKNRNARSGDFEELRSNVTTDIEAEDEDRLAGIKKPLLKIPKLMLKKLNALKKYSNNRPSVPVLPFFQMFNSTIWQDIKDRLSYLGEKVSSTMVSEGSTTVSGENRSAK